MIFSFGDFEFDTERWELREAGSAVDVPPKVMRTIQHLLANGDRVVPKEELFKELWSGVTVTDASLVKAVRTARQVLRDDGDRYIKTIKGRGYRFVAPVVSRLAKGTGDHHVEGVEGVEDGEPRVARRADGAPPRRSLFVGRTRELDQLYSALDTAISGTASFMLVSGGAGIGKTRLMSVLETEALARGARVLWGRACEEGGAPELWLWKPVLARALEWRSAAPSEVEEQPLLQQIQALARVTAPSARGAGFDLLEKPRTEAERFLLFETIVGVLSECAKTGPIVLILEDLHAADSASLQLAQFVYRELRDVPVLTVATFRPLEGSDRFSETLERISTHASTLSLQGLALNETRAILTAELGEAPNPRWLGRVQQITEGNPLFVTELGRTHAGSGASDADLRIPDRILRTLEKRLESVPKRTKEVLSIAAVIGRTFELTLLRRVSDLPGSELLAALEPALEQEIIVAVDAAGTQHRFTHILFRDALYDALSAESRARLHREIGTVLEAAPVVATSSARLAHHFRRAAACVGPSKGAAHSLAAGREAIQALAFHEALEHFDRANEALRFETGADALRAEAMLELGRARRLMGDYPAARETLLVTLELARGRMLPLFVAKAALGYAQATVETGRANPLIISLLEEALAAVESVPHGTRGAEELLALVLSHLATSLSFSDRRSESDALSRRAVDIATAIGNRQVLAYTLHARHWVLWSPESVQTRLELATRVMELGAELGELDTTRQGRICQALSHLELGHGAEVRQIIVEHGVLAERSRQITARWGAAVLESMLALLEGRLNDAERRMCDAFALGAVQGEHPNARNAFALQFWWLRIEQGRAGELAQLSRARLEMEPGNLPLRAGHLHLLAELGETHSLRAELAKLGDYPQHAATDWTLVPLLASLAVACAAAAEPGRAQHVYDRLLPFAAAHVVGGPAIVYLGPVSLYLGLCLRTLGRLDEAVVEFERAAVASQHIGAPTMAARAEGQLAETLSLRAGPHDVERAADLCRRAFALADHIGARGLATQIRAANERIAREHAASFRRREGRRTAAEVPAGTPTS